MKNKNKIWFCSLITLVLLSILTYSCKKDEVLKIGDDYQGGKIFYIDDTGKHGLIASTADQQTPPKEWGCDGIEINGADGTAVGAGNQNTMDIVNGCSEIGTAAEICSNLVLNEYSDWYLPSKDELNLLYVNKDAIGVFSSGDYYSSSEFDKNFIWCQRFSSGSQGKGNKGGGYLGYIRAIRSF